MRYLITYSPADQEVVLQAIYGPHGRVATAPSATPKLLDQGDVTVNERADLLGWEEYCEWQAKQLPYGLWWDTIDWEETPEALLDHLLLVQIQQADPSPAAQATEVPAARIGPPQGLPWDHPDLCIAGDTPWRAGCRLLQTWWRQERLRLAEYGPRTPPKDRGAPQRLVGSMLPLDAPPPASNFLSPEASKEATNRLARKGWGGLVQPDRLHRNLLSSQPLCFNLFGHLKHHPAALLAWVQTIAPQADEVGEVRIEWAPPRGRHFGGGSAFDAIVIYRTAGRLGFIGIETKYAEDLSAQSIKVAADSAYRSATDRWGHWKPESYETLRDPRPVQIWLNVLLAQSCVLHAEEQFHEGTVVVLSCAADHDALDATVQVRSRLHDPNRWLRWGSYEEVLHAIRDHPGTSAWADTFHRRYLDFAPVSSHLDPLDRRHQPSVWNDDPANSAARSSLADATDSLDPILAKGAWVLPNGPDGPMFLIPYIEVVASGPTTVCLRFSGGNGYGKSWDATFRTADLTGGAASWGFVSALDAGLFLSTALVPDSRPEADAVE